MNKIKQWVNEFLEYNGRFQFLIAMVFMYLIAGTYLIASEPLVSLVFYVSALFASLVLKENAKFNRRK